MAYADSIDLELLEGYIEQYTQGLDLGHDIFPVGPEQELAYMVATLDKELGPMEVTGDK